VAVVHPQMVEVILEGELELDLAPQLVLQHN